MERAASILPAGLVLPAGSRQHFEKQLRGKRVLVLGLAYKANVDDDRESPSYKLIQKFEALGANVEYHDPFVPVIPMTTPARSRD